MEGYSVVVVDKVGEVESHVYFEGVSDYLEYLKLTKESEPEVIIYTNRDGTFKGTGHRNVTIINPYINVDVPIGAATIQPKAQGIDESEANIKEEAGSYITPDNWHKLGLKEGDKIFVESTNDTDFTDNTLYSITEIETDKDELVRCPEIYFQLNYTYVDFNQYDYRMFKVEDDE